MMQNSPLRYALMTAVSVLALTCPVQAQDGFAIRRDGETVAGDPALASRIPRAPVRVATGSDIRVVADGLGVRPALDIEVIEATEGRAVVQSRMNYPAWITRSEVRVIDLAAPGRPRTVSVVEITPNGRVVLALPDSDDLVVVHRVYDAAGRYDETAPLALFRPNGDGVATDLETGQELGRDSAALRRIPIRGGAVTVSGTGLAPGAVVTALGETISPDPSGDFVIQRILPPGDVAVPVRVSGGGEAISVEPVVTIPRSEWFTVATGDLTYGRTLKGPNKGEDWTNGRLAYYTKGKTANGWTITSSADTGEAELRDLFRDFDRKDPIGLISRLDPDLAYPTYGDDSTLENDAPTDGKFYFRVERDGSYGMWGNNKAQINGTEYLRNERALYGLSGRYVTPALTSRGEPRASITAYAAQPDMLPGREVFLGTGGSVYFLQRQDISIGSETLGVERRDPDTGRVIDRIVLVEGRDYRINYLQGVVTLSQPLSGLGTGGGVITPAPGSAPETRLVVQYEFTPTAGDIDGFAFGGRADVWVRDDLRFGITGLVEQTDTADQTGTGVDLRWVIGTYSFIEAEYARTNGPGFGQSLSVDGGLTVLNAGSVGGTGDGLRFAAELSLADLGMRGEGTISAYYETRDEGFSTLDYQTMANEDLWGVTADIKASDRLSYRLNVEDYRNADGKRLTEGLAEVDIKSGDRLTYSLGLAHEDRADPADPTETGRRTDVALRLSVEQNEDLTWYVFGQTTVARSGGLRRNDRYGVGAELAFAENWAFEGEISDGSFGIGGRAMLSYDREGTQAYLGYTLDPGRELTGVTLNGRDAGQFVAGGRRDVSDAVEVYGENTYDVFGRHRSLTSAYGVEYQANDFLTFTGGIELGRVTADTGDFDRRALSFGLQYGDEAGLTAKARLELRRDRGVQSGTPADADTIVATADATYKIDDARRLLFTLDVADTKTNGSSVQSGEYAKAVLGYAFRPVDNDRLNLLASYTYLYDMYGQRIDGADDPGPRQQSHVFSIDATYDVNPQWTIGGKLGFRLSQSAPDEVTPLAENDAVLAVLNARYHLTHQWDLLLEGRYLEARQAGITETGVLATAYRHFGPNVMLGLGYNFGNVSDDLTDLTVDDQGVLLNLITQF
jgi:hypothetical protein